MAIALRHSRLIPSAMSFVAYLAAAEEFPAGDGASGLLEGEASGFAIDATSYDTITAEVYEGGPVGGTVSVGTSGVFTSDNVALDNSILTQSGTSAKMVHWNSSPWVRWTPHNYLLRSEVFGTTWSTANASISSNTTTSPDGGLTADTIVEDSTAAARHIAYQQVTSALGVHTASAYLKAKERTHGAVAITNNAGSICYGVVVDLSSGSVTSTSTVGSPSGTSAVTSVGGGWYRVSVTASGVDDPLIEISPSNSATPSFSFAAPSYNGDGTSGIYLWGAQLNKGPIATPYLATTSAIRIGIPQAYDQYEDAFGILIEPAATNLVTTTMTSDGVNWDWNNITRTLNAATAPDGSTTAIRIQEDSSPTTIHRITQNQADTGGVFTGSVYVKAGERTWLALNVYDSGDFYTYFDLTNGVVGTNASGNTATITAIGDGWYRCSASRTMSGDQYFTIGLANADGGASYTGNGTSGFYIWGPQYEAGYVATSYVPTVSATATRARDDVQVDLDSIPYSQVKSTLYADVKVIVDDQNTAGHYFYEVAEDSSNRFNASVDSGNVCMFNRDTGSVSVNNVPLGTFIPDNRHQVTVAYQTNDFDGSLDGDTVVSDSSGTLASAMTTMYLGHFVGGSNALNGFIYRLTYVPRQVETEG